MNHRNHWTIGVLSGLLTAAAWGGPTAPANSAPKPAGSDEIRESTTGNKFPLTGIEPDLALREQAKAVSGSLAIQAIQGTPDGPPIGAAAVKVLLYHRGMLFDTIDARLDEHGVLVVEDLPVSMGIQPVVEVSHADMTYLEPAALMDADHPQQKIQVVCYETTDAPPTWTVQMRHVILAPSPQGLRVRELIVIDNPAQRTWIGTPGPKGKRLTTAFTLPDRAKDVSLGKGFHNWCCTSLSNGRLINHLPLMPNTTELNFSYVVPAVNGSADLDLTAQVAVNHLMVLVPDALQTASVEGLALGGTETTGEGPVRYYMTTELEEGDSASISLTGLAAAPNADDTSVGIAKIVAAVGGGLLLLVTIVIVFSRSAKPVEDGA